jgi:hypothetical protein
MRAQSTAEPSFWLSLHPGSYLVWSLSRSALATTDTELKVVAKPANIGFSNPNAAIGIKRML